MGGTTLQSALWIFTHILPEQIILLIPLSHTIGSVTMRYFVHQGMTTAMANPAMSHDHQQHGIKHHHAGHIQL
ncbi:MAG: hypothetical protein J0M02_00275 [Planctomycetes bacterium]|nr:hypothetical protein [Planctomycetota bacterium]